LLLWAAAVALAAPRALAPAFEAGRVAGVRLVVEGRAAGFVAVLAIVRLILFAAGSQEGHASCQQAYAYRFLRSSEAVYALQCFVAQVFGGLWQLLRLIGYAGVAEPFFAAGQGII
jgi:hypothetical protein